ncbi:hypothetical protein NDU88_003250 [Pleurodeles waltl]|uniref:Uncharacterized protein n=1 Tax=Pleurodeles waltl TaxID=8319 RepID=A0AAV7Q8G0_PLEWA|nr:hypothetical protein NDU88_003250 [Pleurodeles waltl]
MVVWVVIAHEQCVVMGVVVMEVVAEDVVSGDETGKDEEDVEEGGTVEAVDVAVSEWVPFLHEDGPDDGLVAAVEPVDSEEEEAEEEDKDNRNNIIMQYFQ